MFTILGTHEIADVDPSIFSKIGVIDDEVRVCPLMDLTISTKGIKTHVSDPIENCQNVSIIYFEAPFSDEEIDVVLEDNVFRPIFLYRKNNTDIDYVELSYRIDLDGNFYMMNYFLSPVEDCIFGILDEGQLSKVPLSYLWKDKWIRRV